MVPARQRARYQAYLGIVAAAFDTVFLWTVPFMTLSLVLALVMREKPLSAEMIEVVEGKAEVPEY